ncbi:hypothetical protein L6164_030380 [Bauhinia variegata]|uniref:Uncharacterized protein n=1 Tax=Bauhinia variegata TaxID=167791 RepID=A0ACB9LCJ2_BAUVA|nr:hypothetical protein L6164_030380 [Bauhinia variegata]
MQLTLPIYLMFEDVRYKVQGKSVKSSEENRHILHGINGSVHPGEILLLMGTFREWMGYVMQDDVLFPHLTVKETLTYTAVFKNCSDLQNVAKGLGQTISAASLDVKKANTLASIIVMTLMLSGGFFGQEVPSFKYGYDMSPSTTTRIGCF